MSNASQQEPERSPVATPLQEAVMLALYDLIDACTTLSCREEGQRPFPR
jgi:hypothetical protein